MKTLQKLIIFTLLLIQSSLFSQTEKKEVNSKTNNTISKKQIIKKNIDIKNFKNFIGKYNLSEGNITLEIIQEKDKMFIISPWSKDLLELKDKNTLYEPSRGVFLKGIKGNNNALNFFQNGYETTIKRIDTIAKNE